MVHTGGDNNDIILFLVRVHMSILKQTLLAVVALLFPRIKLVQTLLKDQFFLLGNAKISLLQF